MELAVKNVAMMQIMPIVAQKINIVFWGFVLKNHPVVMEYVVLMGLDVVRWEQTLGSVVVVQLVLLVGVIFVQLI